MTNRVITPNRSVRANGAASDRGKRPTGTRPPSRGSNGIRLKTANSRLTTIPSGYHLHETAYGPGISFEGGLDDAIADELVRYKPHLTGPEFHHIRLVSTVRKKSSPN